MFGAAYPNIIHSHKQIEKIINLIVYFFDDILYVFFQWIIWNKIINNYNYRNIYKEQTIIHWSMKLFSVNYFLPSIIIIWYPNFVLMGGSVYTGLAKLDIGRENAASWNGPTIEPLVIQPRSPY